MSKPLTIFIDNTEISARDVEIFKHYIEEDEQMDYTIRYTNEYGVRIGKFINREDYLAIEKKLQKQKMKEAIDGV